MGSGWHSLLMVSSTPPLVGASRRSFPLFYKWWGQLGPTISLLFVLWFCSSSHHFVAFHALVLLLLFHFTATLHDSLLFIPMFCCSFLCFTTTRPHALLFLSMFRYVVPLHVSLLLFLVLCCSSPCFAIPLHDLLHSFSFCLIALPALLLFVMLCYYSSCFVAPPTSLPFIMLCCCSLCFIATICFVAPIASLLHVVFFATSWFTLN